MMELCSTLSLDGSDWEMKDFVGLDWVWRDSVKPDTRDSRWWRPATVPGSVLHDLWSQRAVPDPYFECNSLLVEWVPARSWVFRKWFTLSADLLAGLDNPVLASQKSGACQTDQADRVDQTSLQADFSQADPAAGYRAVATLVFQGIDYAGEIFLNGVSLGRHEGMFVPFEADVTGLLHAGPNLVAVALDPAPPEQPQVGRTSLTRTMKSRMTYWWDFCPRMIHVGLWDHVFIKWSGPARLRDIRLRADIQIAGAAGAAGRSCHSARQGKSSESSGPGGPDQSGRTTANLTLAASFSNAEGCFLRAILIDPASGTSRSTTCLIDSSQATLTWHLSQPRLWQPNGSGDPFEYEIRVELILPDHSISDRRSLRYGLRTIEWQTNPGAPDDGHPFVLAVNGMPTQIKGYNWVPLDVLYGVERLAKTRHLLRLARQAGVNLLRVWGGGLIEKDEFYQACAANGILVWQEFPFSSSGIDNKTPEDPHLLASFRDQAVSIVRSKRNQTALAVWCGGNELTAGPERPLDVTDPLLSILAQVVRDEDPQRRFLPTSPSGGVFSYSLVNLDTCPDQLLDVHGPWEHQGLTTHNTLYNRGTARLHSEFGVEGMANQAGLAATIAMDHLMPAGKDNPVYFHRGAWWNHEALVQTIFQNLAEIDQIRQASQYLQYEGLKYALERNRARAFRCGGSVPWQFNEPYPNAFCTSSVDYYGRPKTGYHAARSAYASVHVAASFASSSLTGSVLDIGLDVCGSEGCDNLPIGGNSMENTGEIKPLVLLSQLFSATGLLLDTQRIPCPLPVNGSFHAGDVALNAAGVPGDVALNAAGGCGDLLLLRLELLDKHGNRLAANEYLFTRSNHFHDLFTTEKVRLDCQQQGGTLRITNPAPVAAWWINIQDAAPLSTSDYVYTSSNYFCLLPGETRVVQIDTSDESPDDRQILLEGFNCRQDFTVTSGYLNLLIRTDRAGIR